MFLPSLFRIWNLKAGPQQILSPHLNCSGLLIPNSRGGAINNLTLSQATSSDTTTVIVNGAFDAEK
jgi:hypothetical protein